LGLHYLMEGKKFWRGPEGNWQYRRSVACYMSRHSGSPTPWLCCFALLRSTLQMIAHVNTLFNKKGFQIQRFCASLVHSLAMHRQDVDLGRSV
jgi:hypothetical protein